MAETEDFTLVNTSSRHRIFDDWERLHNSHVADTDTSLQAYLRGQYPELSLTVTSTGSVSLLAFARAGHATAELDTKDESVQRYCYYIAGNSRNGVPDGLGESRTFAKYNYRWGDEYFIVYIVQFGYVALEYILKEPNEGETTVSMNSVTDELIRTIGRWQNPEDDKYIYVYDGYWTASKALYNEVNKANWKDVILNETMKTTLTELMHNFFDSKEIYQDLGVPWKRGVIFYGPAGNGKTISIKALMHSLFERNGFAIPSLYVKSASYTSNIRSIFEFARRMSPCLLILEDIDTIVTESTRSYFFNEVDGLENNDGLFMVASTNHLDKLDPGLSSRPSRFDRKYLFPLPNLQERVQYCEYWRKKLKNKPTIDFPQQLCLPIARLTDDFSFAYLKEAFVAALLTIAQNRSEDDPPQHKQDGDDDNLNQYELWREIKKQIKLLKDEMGGQGVATQPKSPPRPSITETGPNMSWQLAIDAPRHIPPQQFMPPAPHEHAFGNQGAGIPYRHGNRHLLHDARSPTQGIMLDSDAQPRQY